MENLRMRLENLKGENNLRDAVIEIALNHIDEYNNAEDYFFNVLQSGCKSGIVSELIYSSDTTKFFIEYHEEIFDLFNELTQGCNYISFEINANNLAWLGFEETLRMLAYDLEIDI